ncbi:MAG: Vps62-related protein, partial [Desulfobulbaceae bacterium]|nr:Vps62-related protein [Desulfobulbaceae bacterium]
LDIHKNCGDDRYAYLCYNNAKACPPMPTTIEFADSDKHLLLQKYAPRVWLDSTEIYMPSSVEWAFPYLERFQHPDMNYWLQTVEELDTPSSVLPFFAGDFDSAPVYAFWLKKKIPVGATNINVIDLAYFFYYPYNRGKEVINTIFGNHVGDWEHVTVRLTWQYDAISGWTVKPFQAYVAAHDFGGAYDWDDSRLQKVDDTHPVVYSALGSHGLWIEPGRHKYGEVCWPICEDLVDWCSEGSPWDTWNSLVGFDFTDKQGLGGEIWPTWMSDTFTEAGDCGDPSEPGCGAIYRWGNTEWGSVSGYYRLTNGPTGPRSKEVMTSSDLQ